MIIVSTKLAIQTGYSPTLTSVLPPVRDAWMASLIAAVPGLLLGLIAYALVKRFAGENLYEFNITILGRFFGTIINIGTIIYCIHWTTIVSRQFSLTLDSVVFLRTPDVVFTIAFLILAIIAASQQIEFIGRVAGISGLLVMVGLAFLVFANIPQMDIGMLQPVLAEGWRPVFRQSLTPIGVYAESVWVVLLAVPYLNKLADGPKAISVGVGINALFGAVSSAALMAVFGPELISIITFVPLSAARLIQLGDVLERLEWLLLLSRLGSMSVKVALLLFGARLGISSLFPRWRKGTSLGIAAGLVFIWSLFLFPTITSLLDFLSPNILLPHILPLQLLPIVLIIVALLRGVKTTQREAGTGPQ